MSWISDLKRILGRMRGEAPAEPGPPGTTCHEAVENLFEWLDGQLDAERSARVGEHLTVCARCYPRLAFETSFREAVERAYKDLSAPAEVCEGILTRLEAEGLDRD